MLRVSNKTCEFNFHTKFTILDFWDKNYRIFASKFFNFLVLKMAIIDNRMQGAKYTLAGWYQRC